jgi:hypothetical protein
MPTKTVSTSSQHSTGPGTVLTHSAVSAPWGGYALHDCSGPEGANVSNCIFPLGAALGQPVTFNRGLVVMPRLSGQTGSVSITTV